MRARRNACSLLTASIAVLALPAAAGAEYLVPPGNSAATQYTEAVPTAGGHRDAEKGNPKQNRTASQVLGGRNAKRLEAQGESGREAAEFAAETAPTDGADRSDGKGGDGPGDGGAQADAGSDEEGSTSFGSGDDTDGSGGLGEVIGQATGASSGELGLLLPLAILATGAWALAVLLRRRRRPSH
jgi:hypothetical protein